MAERILLCVDVSYQSYRAAAANPKLEADGIFTGGLYGFLMQFGKAMRETRATDVAFCLDSKPYRRSLDYPDYKLLRKKSQDPELRERMHSSLTMVLELLADMGFSPWAVEGMESDDLIAHAVRKYRHRFSRIYAASNDSDLVQLMDWPEFHLYRDDIKNCWNAKYLAGLPCQMTPAQHMLSSALTGTHNDIAGIPGVGPVNGMKAVLNPAIMRDYRSRHAALIDRNLELIRLPHRDFPRDERIPEHPGGFTRRALYRWLGRYDIDTTLAMADAFEQIQPPRR